MLVLWYCPVFVCNRTAPVPVSWLVLSCLRMLHGSAAWCWRVWVVANGRFRLFCCSKLPSCCGWVVSTCRWRLCGSCRLDGIHAMNSSCSCCVAWCIALQRIWLVLCPFLCCCCCCCHFCCCCHLVHSLYWPSLWWVVQSGQTWPWFMQPLRPLMLLCCRGCWWLALLV